MIMTQSTTTTPSQSKGIDIRDALSILSSRAKAGGDSSEIKSSSDVPSELKNMGQKIDIVNEMEFANKPNALGCDCIRPDTNGDSDIPAVATLSEEEEKKHAVMKAEREKRTKEIQNKLSSMNVGDLLGMIFTAQGERVATYKLYDEGLSTILLSGNITTYPTLCAKITASFSVLSDTINVVKSILQSKKRTDITKVITQLQKYEGEKLNMTAALHLEKLRLRNSEVDKAISIGGGSNSSGKEEEGHDDKTVRLLKDGIQTLEGKISKVIESINEVLEELRCIAVDETE